MAPDAMLDLVEELRAILRGHMMVQSGLTFVREAWVASRFAQARGADAVRIWPKDRPDCELTLGGRRELFEIVEADQPGRKRSTEYKERMQKAERGELVVVECDPVEEWIARAANGPKMLRDAAAKKANKDYEPGISLLIYLNLGEYGIRQKEIEAAMRPATACAKDAFLEVWVLWEGGAYLVWRLGEAVPGDTLPKRRLDEEEMRITDAEIFRSAISDPGPYEADMGEGESSL